MFGRLIRRKAVWRITTTRENPHFWGNVAFSEQLVGNLMV
jgi:hypothetical protein